MTCQLNNKDGSRGGRADSRNRKMCASSFGRSLKGEKWILLQIKSQSFLWEIKAAFLFKCAMVIVNFWSFLRLMLWSLLKLIWNRRSCVFQSKTLVWGTPTNTELPLMWHSRRLKAVRRPISDRPSKLTQHYQEKKIFGNFRKNFFLSLKNKGFPNVTELQTALLHLQQLRSS